MQLEAAVAKGGKARLRSQVCRSDGLFFFQVTGPVVSNVQGKHLHMRTKAQVS